MLVKLSTFHVQSAERRMKSHCEVDNKFFERMEQFKYLGTTITNQISIQEEIKSRF
jgi:hypothetical protein